MNKSDVISHVAEEHALSIDEASFLVNAFFDAVKDALITGDRVEIRGFGSFKTKDYAGYKGRNPKTGDAVVVPPKKLVAFRSGKELRSLIN
ncbi:MAG: HU family DNA-binding protein [Pseudomonadota bacterium]